MNRFLLLTTMLCALSLVAACSPSLVNPCDVLVNIAPAPPDVNRILVERARPTAQGLAMNRGRVQKYGCAK